MNQVLLRKVQESTGNIYAAKIAKIYLTQCSDDDVKNLEREINIISQLKHPAILKFIGFNQNDFSKKPKPAIITEFVPNGLLYDFLELSRKSCGNPNWDYTKKLICIYGIASGMSYLHHKDILHRDLKPANILIDEYLFPKISDFGLSKDTSEQNKLFSSGFKVTYAYSAPEIFEGKYLKAGDVYAFAIIVYEIMTGDIPYQNFSQYDFYIRITKGYRPEFKTDIPTSYRNLIEKCWSNNPIERPTFDEIVDLLKNDQEFITANVDENEFLDYVDFIDVSNLNSSDLLKLKHPDPIYQNSIVNILDSKKYKFSSKLPTLYEGPIFTNYKIMCKKTKNELIATKFISQINTIPPPLLKELTEGFQIFSQIEHPLFAKFIGYSPIDFDSKQFPFVVSDLGSNLSLYKEKLNETEKLIIIYGIAYGMRYLHSEDVIHRCLSTDCIFIDEYHHPKISNLEFLKKVSNESTNRDDYFLGIYYYSAPEVFQKKYSKMSDVYAFAMIAYEVLTKVNVYKKALLSKIQFDLSHRIRPEFTSEIPNCYQNLIKECCSYEIVERLKTDEFIEGNVDANEFNKYVESIEKIQTTHIFYNEINLTETEDNSGELKDNEKEINSTEPTELKFKKISVDFNKNEDTLKNEQALYTEFLELSKFKVSGIISKQDYSKTYKVISKETGEIYSAKISTVFMNDFSRDELISLSREVNIISQLIHPSFLKFIGYSPVDFKKKKHPVIFTELAANGTLRHILDCEREKVHISQWN